MTYKEVIAFYGNSYRFGRDSAMAISNLVNWRRMGYIPIKSQLFLEWESGGKLKASLEDIDKEAIFAEFAKKHEQV